MLRINLRKAVGRFVDRLPPKHRQQVKRKILQLRDDPMPPDSKLLKGEGAFRRTDVGEYRIIYRVEGDTLFVFLVGKRNDAEVYRQLQRLR